MSILINMEMPTSCEFCPCEHDADCLLNRDIICTYKPCKRPPDCPLVPVPPHGRLIDADALKAEGWELQRFRHDEYGCSIICRSLDSDDIPTIITAGNAERRK